MGISLTFVELVSRGSYYDTREMRAVEINASSLGFSEELMMENAGAWVARYASQKGSSFVVLVGKGGKGGDALVAARHLALMGFEVYAVFPYKECEISKEVTLKNLKRAKLSGVKFLREVIDGDVIIDGLLGTGVRGAPRDPVRRLILEANTKEAYKISIDVPSGMDPDTGDCVVCFDSDLVITVHMPKPGLKKIEDKVITVEIGIPKAADAYLGPGDLLLKPRGARKGTNGRVAVVGGSDKYQGAPWISAMASFRAGADLVYVYTPTRFPYPELIWRERKGTEVNGVELVEALRGDKVNVVLVGPGLSDEAHTVTRDVIDYIEKERAFAVFDADSLKVLPELEPKFSWRAILTPHLGEASKLLGRRVEDSLEERVKAAREISERYEACVVLKGPVDVVACADRVVLNQAGTPLMTVGGTGDALAGVASALLARDDPWWASKASLYAVTKAGEKCSNEKGHASPSCIVEEVAKVLNNIS